ncbi:MAG TPA: GNAT family N-acetyltransferase [Candidatus Nanoarchaeia archaeon]|nr:GNAT family N-acetyltransferase [Candidatus Nanoarchaeia archaeon]
MKIKIVRNQDQCRKIWRSLSPRKRVFDIWDFRACFHNSSTSRPYFLVAYDKDRLHGMVPLSLLKGKNKYIYFGGWFPERNSFFMRDKTDLKKLLDRCPKNTLIEGIDPEERPHYNFIEDEYTYYLNLPKYDNNFDTYFASIDKKKQKEIARNVKDLPKYTVSYNRTEDFERLVELNIKQYDGDSLFVNKELKESLFNLVATAKKKRALQMVSVRVKGKVEAVDLGIMTDGWYSTIIGGANSQKIPNIGKLMTMLDIKNAIRRKAKYVDFLATSGYWKSIWNFDKEMLLKFSN